MSAAALTSQALKCPPPRLKTRGVGVGGSAAGSGDGDDREDRMQPPRSTKMNKTPEKDLKKTQNKTREFQHPGQLRYREDKRARAHTHGIKSAVLQHRTF